MKRKETKHHLIGKALGTQYNIGEKKNIIMLDAIRHDALHRLFGVLNAPKEQLMEMYCLYEKVLNDTAKKLFRELLALKDDEFYIKSVLKGTKKTR